MEAEIEQNHTKHNILGTWKQLSRLCWTAATLCVQQCLLHSLPQRVVLIEVLIVFHSVQ